MRAIVSFKEKPSEKTHQMLIAVGAVQCGQTYYAKGQTVDMLRVMAIAERETEHSISLEGGDCCEAEEA